MKNKKSTIGLMLLLAGSLALTNCTKNKTNTAPAQDTDVATTAEVNNVQLILSDIQEICGQVCETNSFLLPIHDGATALAPLSIMQGTNTINSTNATVSSAVGKVYTVTFNNTIGKDGHIRNGVLTFDFNATPASVTTPVYRMPGFVVDVNSTGYSVDNYTVSIFNMRITNTTPIGFPGTSPFFPANYNMTWSQNSNVAIHSSTGTSTLTTMFNGTINKTLLNTNNTAIPMPSASTINTFTVFGYSGTNNNFLKLEYQYAAYTGSGSGTLADGAAYTLTMTPSSPLTRNMVSSPDVFASQNNLLVSSARHPFITGIMAFKPAGKAERTVNYGEAGSIVDYNAKVTIAGITYSTDMK